MKTRIRQATPRDAPALSNIAYAAKAHWGYPKRWMDIWKPQFDFPPLYFDERDGWVADADGKPIAFYTLEERDNQAWIENLWVHPEYMGKRIGKRLFMHALSRSRQGGYLILQLEADPNAVGFYENMGMYKVGEIRYPLEGQTRILPVMEIKL
ncbi:MAG TPA: GNAT family N-acetyltransferase [Anaerolineales bacterium]|nr:GNAT family N-acetyltransferase [Anaerolineales bacterium]